MRVLSLDISLASTGWCFLSDNELICGFIKTNAKFDRGHRLSLIRSESAKLLKYYKPNYIVAEDVFAQVNIKTTKILSECAGVVKEVCNQVLKKEVDIVSTNSVKAYFKSKNKETLFYFIKELLDENAEEWTFSAYNDLTDAIAQAIYFYDLNTKSETFRTEKSYGFLYNLKGVKYVGKKTYQY